MPGFDALVVRLSKYFESSSAAALGSHGRERATVRAAVCGGLVAIWCGELAMGRFDEPHSYLALGFTALYFLVSIVYRSRGPGESRATIALHYLFVVIDPVCMIGALTVDPKTLALLHPFVLVVVVRSGIRYGIRTMYLAWTSAVLATPLLLSSSFWRAEMELTLSFCLMLLSTPIFFSSLIRRVHNMRAIEVERAGVAAMNELMVARSAFLAKVSHELRSPLQGIVSALDVLELRHSRSHDEELIARIRRSSLLLNTHLRDLLTLARGEAGRLELRPETFDACALTENVMAAAGPLASAKALELVVAVPPQPVFVVADGARIDQVLTNLVINSIQHTDAGQVRLSLGAYDPAARLLRFAVADTGRGIAAELIPTLLAPDRAQTGAERRGEGSGIGLAIVRTLVDHLGGEIDVSSAIDRGTTFTIEIPAEPAPEVDERDRATGSGRVLVIDDRSEVLDAIASVVDELGFECDRASSAAVGANLLASRAYGVAFFDLDMPVKGGVALAAETRRGHGPNRLTRFVAMTASAAREDVGADFEACLAKPIERAALRRVLVRSVPASRPSQPGLWSEAGAAGDDPAAWADTSGRLR